MALDESHRRELFDALDTALGPRPAATLMAHLPPVGWADVATKHDLHELERRIDGRFEQVDGRFAQVDGRFEQIDRRFEEVDRRFVEVDRRFDEVDRRLTRVEARLDNVDTRLERVETAVTELALDWRTELVKQSRALFLSLATMTLGGISLAFAAARFGG